jgi:hypothetical protein
MPAFGCPTGMTLRPRGERPVPGLAWTLSNDHVGRNPARRTRPASSTWELEEIFVPECCTKDALEMFALAIWFTIPADRVEARFAGD